METFDKVIDKKIHVTIVAPADISNLVRPLVDIEQYREDALRSCKPLAEVNFDRALLISVLNAAVAMGDVIDYLKKTVVYGKQLDCGEMSKRLEVVADETAHARFLTRQFHPDTEVIDVNPQLLHAVLGLYGESGEMLAALLHQIHGEGLDVANLEEEGGDACWYILGPYVKALMELGGCDVQGMLKKNIAKLKVRFPGLFSLAASESRDVEAEMAAMRLAERASA